MKSIIFTLLGINLYLLIDFVLDVYYFNGTRKKGILILNRHLYYEVIQMGLFISLIFILFYALKDVAIIGWLFSIVFVIVWANRIRYTYKNINCEIQIGNEKIVFVDHTGGERILELPIFFSIYKEEGNRLSITSKSIDYVMRVRNKKGEELMVNLTECSLDVYTNEIYKTVLRNFGAKAYEGIKPWKWLDLKKLLFSFLILLGLFGLSFILKIN